jgi:cytoskeletal protein RodZ
MAEFRSFKDVFRNPLIMALVLVVITGLLAAVVANYQNSQEGRGSQDARATNQPSTQSLPVDTKPQSTQSDSQAPAITEPSTQAPETGETQTP